jgi:hypothetical protein
MAGIRIKIFFKCFKGIDKTSTDALPKKQSAIKNGFRNLRQPAGSRPRQAADETDRNGKAGRL